MDSHRYERTAPAAQRIDYFISVPNAKIIKSTAVSEILAQVDFVYINGGINFGEILYRI